MKIVGLVLLALSVVSGEIAMAQGPAGQPSGSHGVRNEQYGLFLRPRDASNKDGEPIVLYPFQPWKCMAWRFESGAEGTRLVNFFTGKSFEVAVGNGKGLVQLPASERERGSESFRFVAVGNGLYEITSGDGNALTGVDVDGHGDIRVVVTPWRNVPAQRWRLEDIPGRFTM